MSEGFPSQIRGDTRLQINAITRIRYTIPLYRILHIGLISRLANNISLAWEMEVNAVFEFEHHLMLACAHEITRLWVRSGLRTCRHALA